MKPTYKEANKLAGDLSEMFMALDCDDVPNGADIAKIIRQQFGGNSNMDSPIVNEYESRFRSIRFAVGVLMEGVFNDYKLVKIEEGK